MKPMPILRALACACLLLVACAPSAQAGFRVNSAMEGVTLGMTAAEVRERVGDPRRVSRGTDFVDWIYRRPPMTVTLKPAVVALFTRSKRIRGPRDIGVGTRQRRLRTVLGSRVRCTTEAARRLCVVGSFATGRRSTVFEMRRGRVATVTISLSTP